MAEETTERPRPSLSPPPPPKREPRQEPRQEQEAEEDPVAQARAKLEDAQEAISDALDLLEG